MRAERATLGGGWGRAGLRHLFVCPDCQANVIIEDSPSRVVLAVVGLLLMGGGAALLLAVPTLGGLAVGMLGLFFGGWGIVSGFLSIELRYSVTGDTPGEVRRVEVEESLAETAEEKAKEAKRNKRSVFIIWAIVVIAAVVIAWDIMEGVG